MTLAATHFYFPDPTALAGEFPPGFGLQPEWYGAVGNGDVANMAADTHGWQMAIDASAETGLPVTPRGSTYIIDGHKGDHDAWSPSGLARHGGLVMTDGARILGSGRGKTILKNGADYWRSVVRFRSGTCVMRDLTIDGDIDNHVMVSVGEEDETHGSVRGEGIIFEGNGTIPYFELSNLDIKNTAHYGIGLENVTINGGLIDNIFFENIGGDLIDSKSYNAAGGTHPKKDIYVYNVRTVDGSQHHYPDKYVPGEGYTDQSCFDVCRGMHYRGIFISGFNTHAASQTGTTAVRFRAEVLTSLESGEGASASLVRIYGSKAANTGEHDVNEIVGLSIETSGIHVSDVVIDNCFTGVTIGAAADDVPLWGSLHDVTVTNCSSAAGAASVELLAAIGLNLGSGTSSIFASNIVIRGCEVGTRIAGTGHHLDLRIEDSLISHVFAADGALRQNLLRLSLSRDNVTPSIGDFDPAIAPMHAGTMSVAGVSPLSAIFNREIAISNDRRAFVNFIATANDNLWTGDDQYIGGIQMLSADADGAGAGIRGAIRCGATLSGATTHWEFSSASTVANDVPVFVMGSTLNVTAMPLKFPEYTIATLPVAADHRACIVMITDPVGNKRLIFCDGTVWRYPDGTAV